MLLDPAKSEEILTVDHHRLKFTNLNKLYYPKDKIAKRDLINYYDAVAPLIVPHLKDRPLSLKRYPNGIDAVFFFQKATPDSFPKWLRTADADGIEARAEVRTRRRRRDGESAHAGREASRLAR